MATEAVLNDQASVEKGDNARMMSFVGAIAICDMVKTTLGPKGMDKILVSVSAHDKSISVTNDGATILKSVHVDNAAAKVLIDIAKTQDDEVGDGTTSVAVLCGELLREAEALINARIHPQTVIHGWRKAAQIARGVLESLAWDNAGDPERFRADLLAIAKTTLSSKILTHDKDHFAELAVDAVLRLKGSGQLEYIQVIKKPGGSLRDSYLENGFVLDKRIGVGQPKRVENARVLVANTSMDADKIKIYGSRVRVDSIQKVAAIEEAERDKMRRKCQKIIDHGVNVFINRQLIYNFPEQIFTDAGMVSIEHADFEGIERLAKVLGAEIASTFDHPELVRVGECALVDEILIGEDRLLRFSGCRDAEACTVVLRGASPHVLDEAERSLHDALCVLTQTVKDARCVPGGGCCEVAMAAAVDAAVPQVAGKQQLAMEAYARALRQLPTIIADNAGYDSSEMVTQLRAAHAAGRATAGLDMRAGEIGDMNALGIRESYKSKLQVVASASEAAEMILRVDDIIKCAPRQREA
mmetsp:Transcript_10640/g.14892  ORF Transcript_10640/g.14892 Transcript_10640/m.14892 type:complete len:527 (+) Transcript_10640:74-1654(+)